MDDADRSIVVEIDVWWCHRTAVDVFMACMPEAIGTFGGIQWMGISASELRSALLIRRVPRADWLDVGDDVRFMGRVVADERNRRQEERSRRGRK